MRHLILTSWIVSLVACDDFLYKPAGSSPPTETAPPTETGPTTTDAEGWCAVVNLIGRDCVTCHTPSLGPLGDLDLDTDPYTALVGVPSMYPGRTLVVPGDPDASFLVVKLEGLQTAKEGTVMPPTGPVDASELEAVRAWIADGASSECDDPGTTEPETYHPKGFEDEAAHGLAAKLQEDTCVTCHGTDLAGGKIGISCDTCHPADWRTDCTFCHGGTLTEDGAPPRDIDGTDDPALISFSPHVDHVTTDIHEAYDCTQCHTTPSDVLSVGHLFLGDTTPAVSEVSFGGGLSAGAAYSGGTCSDTYCHGTGRATGDVTVATGSDACNACHPDATSPDDDWDDIMSGEHKKHLEEGLQCSECHGATVSGNSTIVDPAMHVNGTPDLQLAVGMTWSEPNCSGSCHGETHYNESW